MYQSLSTGLKSLQIFHINSAHGFTWNINDIATTLSLFQGQELKLTRYSWVDLKDLQMKGLVSLLMQNRSLQVLTIPGTTTEQGMKEVSQLITQLPHLHSLTLETTKGCNNSVHSILLEALKKNTTLQKI